jgi:hypothetical protein
MAGLTIAKDRARLASDAANELLFLHMPYLGFKNILKPNSFEASSKRGRSRGFLLVTSSILICSCIWIMIDDQFFHYCL